jgi:hypothetical protein
LLAGLALAAPAAAQTAQFKGLAAVTRELSSRIAPPNEPIDLYRFLPADGLETVLGTWSNFGSEHNFRNGSPNALNMVVWHVTLSRFAAALGESCTTPRLALEPHFRRTMAALCAWPTAPAQAEPVMQAFWLGIMGYGAPRREYVAWRDFFRAEYGARPAAETIRAMTLAITLNPYFLLGE